MKQIKFGLSPKEIQTAVKQLQQYKVDLNRKCQLLIQALTAKGIDIAKFNVQNLGAFYTGELESSIDGYYSPSLGVGIIYAGSFYAVYVEFGTGIIGQQSPHPLSGELGYVYDVNNPWRWVDGYDGQYPLDNRNAISPFMYNTVKQLDLICEKGS